MPPFEKPDPPLAYDVAAQVVHLRAWKQHRKIPDRAPGRLLLGTWNLANFGEQQRREQDLRLMAEILSWFDLVAVQEVKDNVAHLRAVQGFMGGDFDVLYSGLGGNQERMAFLFDRTRVAHRHEVGVVDVAPSDYKSVKVKGVAGTFAGFDRDPYLATFEAGDFLFTLANVHLYFGKPSAKGAAESMTRRVLETAAVARWAELRNKSPFALTKDIIALGDFNLPRSVPGDKVFDALTERGLAVPDHSSRIGSSIAADADYDQIALFPGETGNEAVGPPAVFDYDGGVFPEEWLRLAKGKDFTTLTKKEQQAVKTQFNACLRYYLSDHRPMWIQFKI